MIEYILMTIMVLSTVLFFIMSYYIVKVMIGHAYERVDPTREWQKQEQDKQNLPTVSHSDKVSQVYTQIKNNEHSQVRSAIHTRSLNRLRGVHLLNYHKVNINHLTRTKTKKPHEKMILDTLSGTIDSSQA